MSAGKILFAASAFGISALVASATFVYVLPSKAWACAPPGVKEHMLLHATVSAALVGGLFWGICYPFCMMSTRNARVIGGAVAISAYPIFVFLNYQAGFRLIGLQFGTGIPAMIREAVSMIMFTGVFSIPVGVFVGDYLRRRET